MIYTNRIYILCIYIDLCVWSYYLTNNEIVSNIEMVWNNKYEVEFYRTNIYRVMCVSDGVYVCVVDVSGIVCLISSISSHI